jgi:hypothetical protein
MTQAGERENFGRPVCTRESQPVHPAHSGFAEESCDTGEGEGDEDPTGDLERQRVKGIQILQPWAPFGVHSAA